MGFELISDPIFSWSAIFFLVSLLGTARLVRKILSPSISSSSAEKTDSSASGDVSSPRAELFNLREDFRKIQSSIETLDQIFFQFSKNLCETMEKEIHLLQKSLEKETAQGQNQIAERKEQLSSLFSRFTTLQKQSQEEEIRAHASFELFRKKMQEEQEKLVKETEMNFRSTEASAALLRRQVAELSEMTRQQLQTVEQKFQKDFALHLENQKALLLQKQQLESQLVAFRTEAMKSLKTVEFEIEKTKNQIQSLELNRKEKILEREKLHQEETARWTAKIASLREQKQKEQMEVEKVMMELKRQETEISQRAEQVRQQLTEEYEKKFGEIRTAVSHLENEIQSLKETLDKERSQNMQKEKELSLELARLSAEEKKLKEERELNEASANISAVLGVKKLQDEIAALELELEKSRRFGAEQIHKKELELKEWKARLRTKEEEVRNHFHLQEKRETEEKIRLEEEKIRVQEVLSQQRFAAKQQMEGLTLELTQLRQTLLEKENEWQKKIFAKNRELEKTKEKLIQKLNAVKEQLQKEEKEREKELKKKESIIQMLKVKLSWRRDRLEAELARRNEQLEKWTAKVKKEIEVLREQKTTERSITDLEFKRLTGIIVDLEKLKEDKMTLAQQVASEKEMVHASGVRLGEEIQHLEQEWKKALLNFEKLIGLKEKEISLLGQEIEAAEKRMEKETKKSQSIISEARKIVSSLPPEVSRSESALGVISRGEPTKNNSTTE